VIRVADGAWRWQLLLPMTRRWRHAWTAEGRVALPLCRRPTGRHRPRRANFNGAARDNIAGILSENRRVLRADAASGEPDRPADAVGTDGLPHVHQGLAGAFA
jgi:hypothetical protein